MKHASFFEGKKILITGGNGYIASNVIRLIRNTSCQIIRFDRTGTNWNDFDFDRKIQFKNIEGDIRNEQIWNTLLNGVDIIFHFAAQTSINVSNKNPIADLEVNVLPLLKMLQACGSRNLNPSIIYSGTVTEAGFTSTLPVNESHADRPTTIYDIHKLTGENYIKHFSSEGIIRGAILRLSNVYGPGPKSSQADRGILNQMVAKAIKGEDLTVYGDGNFIRDYIYIEDIAKAFLSAAENIGLLNGQHFMIGSNKGTTIQEAFKLVAHRVALKTKVNANVIHVDPPKDLPKIESRNFVADIKKFSGLTRWTPTIDLKQGIDLTIDWYLNNQT